LKHSDDVWRAVVGGQIRGCSETVQEDREVLIEWGWPKWSSRKLATCWPPQPCHLLPQVKQAPGSPRCLRLGPTVGSKQRKGTLSAWAGKFAVGLLFARLLFIHYFIV